MIFEPAIDRAARLLKCLPGQVPAAIETLLERGRMRLVSEPPAINKDVLLYDVYGNRFVGYLHRDGTWCSDALGDVWPYGVVGWWELPPGPEK